MYVGVVEEALDTNPTKILGRVAVKTQYIEEKQVRTNFDVLGKMKYKLIFLPNRYSQIKKLPQPFPASSHGGGAIIHSSA
jgi:hypothetical protein